MITDGIIKAVEESEWVSPMVVQDKKSKEVYSFTDGFLGYHQIRIHKEERHKTTFATEWGYFEYTVMPFALKNAPLIFCKLVVAVFKEYIHKFVEVYFNDCTIFGLLKKHVEALRLMLSKCRQHQISLNLKKCIFCVPFGILLGHIVSRQGLMVDPAKISIIVNLPPPN